MLKRIALVISLSATAAFADDATGDAAQKDLVMKKTLAWMCDSDPEKRAIAFRSLQAFDEIGPREFQSLLEKARQFHEKKLTDILISASGRSSPYQEFAEDFTELTSERERVIPLIRTDYHKEADKIRMLEEEMEKLDRLYDRSLKAAAKDPTEYDDNITKIASALAEVYAEIAKIEEEDPTIVPDSPKSMIGEMAGGEEYLDLKEGREDLLASKNKLDLTAKEHAKLKWAGPSRIEFANHLNSQRAILGLSPFALEEKLSDAATGHSEDMIRLGFFAHESPVEGKKTPGDRAKLAGFQYAWSGENIFMGSSSPISAYNAWFGSDGHRFIMMASGPNLIGVGPVNNHWTMMTGTK